MAVTDVVNRVFREFKRYTGDGLPGEPANAPLPVGDPSSGPHNPKKSELREAFLQPLISGDERVEWAQEWAQSEAPISVEAGGDGASDRSAKAWATQSQASAESSEAERIATAAQAALAADLVQEAVAGFSGFTSGQSYDFGSIATATTYFNQDWGTL